MRPKLHCYVPSIARSPGKEPQWPNKRGREVWRGDRLISSPSGSDTCLLYPSILTGSSQADDKSSLWPGNVSIPAYVRHSFVLLGIRAFICVRHLLGNSYTGGGVGKYGAYFGSQRLEDLVTFQTEAAVALEPNISDLVPHEAPSQALNADPAGSSSFPKVLRRRLDQFFAEREISPKADRAMWFKIAAGMAVLLGSRVALYAYRPDLRTFVSLYV